MRYFLVGLIIVLTGLLAGGYFSTDQPIAALIVLLLGGLWLLGRWRDLPRAGIVAFSGLALLAAFGVLRSLPVMVTLPAMVLGLVAWDLDHFTRRLVVVENVRDETALKRRHLVRLAIIVGLAILLAELALNLKISLVPSVAIGLGLIVVFGLSRVIRYLRRESE